MLFRAYSILFRRRLIAAALTSLLAPAFFVYVTTNVCDCAGDTAASRLRLLLASFSIVSLLLGIVFGIGAAVHTPGTPNQARFLLIRPIPRVAMQFYPLAIAASAILVFPAGGWLTVLGVLGLTHAASLPRLIAAVSAYPKVLSFGPHPSIFVVLGAIQTGRRYLASVSVGIAIFAFFGVLQWCTASTNQKLRQIGISGLVLSPVLLLVLNLLWGSYLSQAILLVQFGHGQPDYVPSSLGIALHIGFAAACICTQFAAMRHIEV
jgi:hypothetical protein